MLNESIYEINNLPILREKRVMGDVIAVGKPCGVIFYNKFSVSLFVILILERDVKLKLRKCRQC